MVQRNATEVWPLWFECHTSGYCVGEGSKMLTDLDVLRVHARYLISFHYILLSLAHQISAAVVMRDQNLMELIQTQALARYS